jgi:SAM-dependent methyltransferase
MPTAPLPPELVPLLRCPACFATPLTASVEGAEGAGVRCKSCGRSFERRDGVLDLGLQPDTPEVSVAQRLMEHPLFAKVYEQYWRPLAMRGLGSPGREAEEFSFRHALGVGEQPGPWLDLSCGPANIAKSIAHVASKDLVVGVDLSLAMLGQAADKLSLLPNLALVRGDAMSLPLADGVVSGCVNSLALHLYPDPERAFREVFRVLRPRGAYVATTLTGVGVAAVDAVVRQLGLRVWEEDDLKAALARVGFVGFDAMRSRQIMMFCVRKP